MAGPKRLARIDVEGGGDRFVLRIVDEAGQATDLIATRDQLDMLADTLDDALLSDDEADEAARRR